MYNILDWHSNVFLVEESGAHRHATFLIPQGPPVRSVVTNAFSKRLHKFPFSPPHTGFLENDILVLAGINLLVSITLPFFFFLPLAAGPGRHTHRRIDMQQS